MADGRASGQGLSLAPGFRSRGHCFHPTPSQPRLQLPWVAFLLLNSHAVHQALGACLSFPFSTREGLIGPAAFLQMAQGGGLAGRPPGHVRPRPERPRAPCCPVSLRPDLPSSPSRHPSVLLLPFLMPFLAWGQPPPHSHSPLNSQLGNTVNSKSRGRVFRAEGSSSAKAPGQDGAQRGQRRDCT